MQEESAPAPNYPVPAKQSGPGRPSKLTPGIAAQICKFVGEGSFYEPAAVAAGVTDETIRQWLLRGREDKSNGKKTKYSVFLEMLNHAQSAHEQRLASTLSRGGDGKFSDWRAQAFILERRYKQRWAEERTQQVSPVTINIGTEAAAALADALAVAAAPGAPAPLQVVDASEQGLITDVMSTSATTTPSSANQEQQQQREPRKE